MSKLITPSTRSKQHGARGTEVCVFWWNFTSKQIRVTQPTVITATAFWCPAAVKICDMEVCETIQTGNANLPKRVRSTAFTETPIEDIAGA